MGDKLNLLDKDGDGELSSEELKDAIVKILKRTSSLQEANDLIAVLDSDKDGKGGLGLVSVLYFFFILCFWWYFDFFFLDCAVYHIYFL